jgi:hypothetical protein
MGDFDSKYMDESTRIIHSWSQRSYDELTTMFSGDIAQRITKVTTRWCATVDKLLSGMWVFVVGSDKALVFTPDMMIGGSGIETVYCELFLKTLGVDPALIEQKAQIIKDYSVGIIEFVRRTPSTYEGWEALATMYGPKL